MTSASAVTITITGGQGEITNVCDGQYYYKNGQHYVLFREELAEDGGAQKTVFSSRLKISEDQVVLRRSLSDEDASARKHVMEFIYREQKPEEPGCFVDYPSPYGVMRLEIRTKKLRIKPGEEEMELRIFYHMLQEGQEVSRDELKILIKKN